MKVSMAKHTYLLNASQSGGIGERSRCGVVRPWTMVARVFEECHIHSMLRTSFADFGREYAHCSHYNYWFRPYQTLHTISVLVKNGWSFPQFYIIFYISLHFFSFWMKMKSIIQLINQSINEPRENGFKLHP